MLNKTIAALVLSLGLVASATLCAAEELNFYTWRFQEQTLWDEINRQGLIPGVTVQVRSVNYDSYRSHIYLELQNDKADLFQWAPGAASLQPLIERGYIRPYTGGLDMINQSALAAAQGADGQFYGVPFALQLQALIGNGKLLAQHGLTQAPQSMQQLHSAFDRLAQAGINPLHISASADWYVSQLLAEVLVAGLVDEGFAAELVAGEACFSDERYTAIFAQLQQWQAQGYLNSNAVTEDYTGMNNAVGLGNSAMAVEGGWKASPDSDFYKMDPSYQFAFWPIPGAGGKVYALGDGTYQANARSPKSDAANKVLEFVTTKTFAEMFAKYVNEVPAYAGELSIQQPSLQTMSRLLSQQAYGVSLFTAYGLNRGAPSYNQLVISAIRAVLKGEQTPEAAGEAIQSGLNSWSYAGANRCAL